MGLWRSDKKLDDMEAEKGEEKKKKMPRVTLTPAENLAKSDKKLDDMEAEKGEEKKKKMPRVTLTPAENLANIAVSAQAIASNVETVLRTRGSKLGLADWALLRNLAAENEAQPMAKMAILMGVTRQRIQKQVNQLAETKLVHVQTNAEDKRVRNISLTKMGHDALAATSNLWPGSLAESDQLKKVKNLDGIRHHLDKIAARLGKSVWTDLRAERRQRKASKTA